MNLHEERLAMIRNAENRAARIARHLVLARMVKKANPWLAAMIEKHERQQQRS